MKDKANRTPDDDNRGVMLDLKLEQRAIQGGGHVLIAFTHGRDEKYVEELVAKLEGIGFQVTRS